MQVNIKELAQKSLIGKSVQMSLANNKTFEVWQSFMREKSKIKNQVGTDLYSIQVYPTKDYFKKFNPQNQFTKWAAIEVTNHHNIPEGFLAFLIPAGAYAVFKHKGATNTFQRNLNYIFTEWLPQSSYLLDHRPHFELLGNNYKNGDPNSEEEVWIPICKTL